MLRISAKNKFNKDLRRMEKQGRNLKKLKSLMIELCSGNKLDKKFLDHPLRGEFNDCRECHIEPDWLLIYMIRKDEIIFIRTGSHSELFK